MIAHVDGFVQDRPGFRNSEGAVSRLMSRLYTAWVRVLYTFASLGKNVRISFTSDLRNTDYIAIADDVTIKAESWVHANPVDGHNSGPTLILHDRCYIGPRSHLDAQNRIEIEQDVHLAASVLIQDHGHAFSDVNRPIGEQGATEGGTIRIEKGTWIDQGAAILCDKGELVIGRNSVVAANSVVTRSAPPDSYIFGNPAKIVKRTQHEKEPATRDASHDVVHSS